MNRQLQTFLKNCEGVDSRIKTSADPPTLLKLPGKFFTLPELFANVLKVVRRLAVEAAKQHPEIIGQSQIVRITLTVAQGKRISQDCYDIAFLVMPQGDVYYSFTTDIDKYLFANRVMSVLN
jgi:hypothetical protein